MKKILNFRGFTLIELLIVITVLGVLAGIILIVINPAKQMAKAKDSAKKTTVSQLADALQSYQALNSGKYPAASITDQNWIDKLVTSGDLKRVPPLVTSSCPPTAIHQNGYCYKTNPPENTETVVYTSLESSGIIECAPDCTPYFVWASADNASGIFPLAEGEGDIPGTSGFIFGPSATLTQGLVGWWKMNGNANNSSSDSNHGTVVGAILTTDIYDQPKKAYSFDGTGVITVPNFINQIPGSEITIAAWVNPAATTGNRDMICTDPFDSGVLLNRMSIHFPTNNKIYWLFGNPINPQQLLSVDLSSDWVGIWSHYVFISSISRNFARIYRNGVQVATQGFTHAYDPTITNGALRIGGRAGVLFQGSIDDLRIYNRALLPSEIINLFDAGPQ